MPSALPAGEPAPSDGASRSGAGRGRAAAVRVLRPRAVLHGPLRLLRLQHLHRRGARPAAGVPGASRATYAEAAIAEVRRARAGAGRRATSRSRTVFFGGGTPTLLSPATWRRSCAAIDAEFGLAAGAEVTTESNPDSVTAAGPRRGCARAGFNRISFGMQSAVDHVLGSSTAPTTRCGCRTSWRGRGRPGSTRSASTSSTARRGSRSPTGSASLDAALACEPDHVSAYSLIVEEGTALARRVRRGELPMPDEDDLADKYLLADERLDAAGLGWYEVSNWARDDASRCRHNLLYWTGGDWWGVGPGAHSHVGGVRWWNVKHPAAYAERLARRAEPGAGPRGARRRDPAGGAGAAGAAAPRRACRSTRSTTPAERRCRSWWPRAARRPRATGWCSTRRGPAARRRGGPRPRARDLALSRP